jgi:hypothetical protein
MVELSTWLRLSGLSGQKLWRKINLCASSVGRQGGLGLTTLCRALRQHRPPVGGVRLERTLDKFGFCLTQVHQANQFRLAQQPHAVAEGRARHRLLSRWHRSVVPVRRSSKASRCSPARCEQRQRDVSGQRGAHECALSGSCATSSDTVCIKPVKRMFN